MTNSSRSASTNRPVLILGASPRVVVPIARSLARIGVRSDVATFNPTDSRIRARCIVDFHRLPPSENVDFSDALCSLINRRGFDMLVPATDRPLAAMAQNYERLSSLLYLACPPPEIVARVLNKAETLRIAEGCGIPVPKTRVIDNIENAEAALRDLRFPVVLKPRDAERGRIRAVYADSPAAVASILRERAIDAALVQEFCPGSGVGLEILMHDGEPLAVFQHRRLKEVPPGGGVAVMAVAEKPDTKLAEASITLLRALKWEGVAMVEYRHDPTTGATALMEVNGRFWGTTALPIAAGMDFPVYLWRIAHGQDPEIPKSYRIGTRWRHTPGYVSRARQVFASSRSSPGARRNRWRELSEVPRDLSPKIHDAVWNWSDPVPGTAELTNTGLEILRADLKWFARKLSPQWLLREKNTYERLGRNAGRIYLQLRALDRLGIAFGNRRKAKAPVASVLFVCKGNIMRSAMAEEVLKDALRQSGCDSTLRVQSCGLHVLAGTPAHPWALSACGSARLSLATHRSKKVSPEMIDDADVIFAMDFQNKAELLAGYPEAGDRIFMLSAYAHGPVRGREIPDPYSADEASTLACFKLLQECITTFVRECVPFKEAPAPDELAAAS